MTTRIEGVIESQRGEIYRALAETNNFDEINHFCMNNYQNKTGIFVKLMRIASMKWKN